MRAAETEDGRGCSHPLEISVGSPAVNAVLTATKELTKLIPRCPAAASTELGHARPTCSVWPSHTALLGVWQAGRGFCWLTDVGWGQVVVIHILSPEEAMRSSDVIATMLHGLHPHKSS